MQSELKQPAWLNTLRIILIISFVILSVSLIRDIIELVKNIAVFSLRSYEVNLSLRDIIFGGFSLFLLWQFYRLLPVFKTENIISTKVYQQINGIGHTVYYVLLARIVFQIVFFALVENNPTDLLGNMNSYINREAASYRFGYHFGGLFRVAIINNIDLIIITAVLWLFTRVFQRAVLLQQEQNLTI